jgi:hypothetical protein
MDRRLGLSLLAWAAVQSLAPCLHAVVAIAAFKRCVDNDFPNRSGGWRLAELSGDSAARSRVRGHLVGGCLSFFRCYSRVAATLQTFAGVIAC